MATSVKSALTRYYGHIWLSDPLWGHCERSRCPTLSACKIRRDHFNSLWQTVKAAYDICFDCIIAAGESAADTKSILTSKYNQTYSTYKIFGTNPKKAPPLKLQPLRPKIPRLMAVGSLLSTQRFSLAIIFAGRLSGTFSRQYT